jgi:hypothetical protein
MLKIQTKRVCIEMQLGTRSVSVANRPKFLPQNTKVAGKKYERQKKTAADSAPKFGQKGQKSGRKYCWRPMLVCELDKNCERRCHLSLP